VAFWLPIGKDCWNVDNLRGRTINQTTGIYIALAFFEAHRNRCMEILMKAFLLGIALFGLVVFSGTDLRAQIFDPYGVNPYWELQYQQYLNYQNYLQWQQHLGYMQQVDPYWDLHLIHYQLYLAPYSPYLSYPACCYVSGFSPLRGSNWVPFGSRGLMPYGGMLRR